MSTKFQCNVSEDKDLQWCLVIETLIPYFTKELIEALEEKVKPWNYGSWLELTRDDLFKMENAKELLKFLDSEGFNNHPTTVAVAKFIDPNDERAVEYPETTWEQIVWILRDSVSLSTACIWQKKFQIQAVYKGKYLFDQMVRQGIIGPNNPVGLKTAIESLGEGGFIVSKTAKEVIQKWIREKTN